MKLILKILYTILLLPGVLIFWLLIGFFASENARLSTDYLIYGLPVDLGKSAIWSFPVALLVGLIVLIVIWSSGKKKQDKANNSPIIDGEVSKPKSPNDGSGEYQSGNLYS